MIVFDKTGKEHNITLGIKGKCTLEKFKAIFHNVPFDYEKIFVQLGGKIKDNGSNTDTIDKSKESKPSGNRSKGSKEK